VRESEIVDMVSRKLTPYILLLGLYLISFGHLSPGGGFQGGAVLATGVIQLALARGVKETRDLFPLRRFNLVETAGFFLFLLIGAIGMFAGLSFLGNFHAPRQGELDHTRGQNRASLEPPSGRKVAE